MLKAKTVCKYNIYIDIIIYTYIRVYIYIQYMIWDSCIICQLPPIDLCHVGDWGANSMPQMDRALRCCFPRMCQRSFSLMLTRPGNSQMFASSEIFGHLWDIITCTSGEGQLNLFFYKLQIDCLCNVYGASMECVRHTQHLYALILQYI